MKKPALIGLIAVVILIIGGVVIFYPPKSSVTYAPMMPVKTVIDGTITIEDEELIPLTLAWRPIKINFPAPETVEETKWPNGKLRAQIPKVQGMNHGLSKYWHENGQLSGEVPFVRGEKHGIFTLYNDNGTKQADLSFSQGRPHGLATWYDEQGRVKQKSLFFEGRVISQDPNLERK